MLKILRTFYYFLLKNRHVSVLFFMSIVVTPLVGSLHPYFYKLMVDFVTENEFRQVVVILFIYIGVRFLHMLLDMLQFYLGDILTIDALADTKETVFKHIHDLDFAFHTSKSSGSLISAIKRGDGAFWSLHFSLHYRVVNVFITFLVMIYFFRNINLLIFSIALLSFILALIVAKIFVNKNITTRKIVNKREDTISAVIVDNMVNFETVKLFANEMYERIRLRSMYGRWKKAVWKNVLTFRFLDASMGTVINLSVLLMIFIALDQTIKHKISIGDLVLVIGFTGTFYPKLFELVWGFREIAKNYADIERYFELLDYKIQVKDPKSPVKITNLIGEIEYKNVSFSYGEGEVDAVKSINLKIRPGQSLAFVGKSGVGKTTLVKLLMRFFDVDKGNIVIDGVDIRNIKKSNLRSFMGVVPQEPILFNNSIAYNIAYGKGKASKREIEAAAKLANINDFISNLPRGYNSQVGERGIKLSGGQKQRVAIARMILSDPDIIIFDEATSQLDSESEKLIQDAFWKAVRNKTTIVIAHRLSTVMRVDKIIVMEGGKIVEAGSHRDLIRKEGGLYKRFWDLQKID